MEKLGLNEIRENFLSFFEDKGHLRLASFPLVPQNDNSLLLVNSGMAPLKPYFTGEQAPPRARVTTCQKCIRTPDIERVGKTARHGTYFEMLGNFSFGDYFKREAAAWAWEFVTQVMKMPAGRLWVSIYLDDDEAYDIWTKEVGVSKERMVRLGREDNFWEIGTGPCGPCSEIYFDRGEKYGCGSPDCAVGCDCDRYVEFWNLVFSQFNSDGNGNYTPLEKKNIDTGMGLERLACIMQGVDNLFEVDTVANIMAHVCRIAGIRYHDGAKSDVSLRVITDHIRSTVMMICDGIIPSNEGRGYVLRRLLRRAARHGKLLGIERAFLTELSETVIRENAEAYPQLNEKADYIKKVISMEEKRFQTTIDSGLKMLSDIIGQMKAEKLSVLSGESAFRLYDTYGFPVDITLDILEEHGLGLDRAAFDTRMEEQKKRARAARERIGDLGWAGENLGLDKTVTTEFTGYKTLDSSCRVLAVLSDGEAVDSAAEGRVIVVLDRTPFYAESGGQSGDMGIITCEGQCVLNVTGVHKTPDGKYLHTATIITGVISVGDTARAKVDGVRRRAIERAHSSTHLLQRALRNTLGSHVEQAGSLVEPDRLRFDFTHFEATTPEELLRVEHEVNEAILRDLPVTADEMPIGDAKKLGAMALFGEKYGDTVRVVRMGEYSAELCGGTHLSNTAKAGSFKILSESSIASGVRRIEAVVGAAVIDLMNERQASVNRIAEALKTTAQELPSRAAHIAEKLSELTKQVEKLDARLANAELAKLISSAGEIGGIKLIASKTEGVSSQGLRLMCDSVRDRYDDAVIVLACVEGDKIAFAASCGKAAVSKGAHAGNILREISKLAGGGGGGRPDSATAGGKDVARLQQALSAVKEIVEKQLK